MTILGAKLVNIRFVIEFNVSVAVMDKTSNFPLNSTVMQQAQYFCDINYCMLEKKLSSPGRGWSSLRVYPLNTPLDTANET